MCCVYVYIGLGFKIFFYTPDTNIVTRQMKKNNLLFHPGNLSNVHLGTTDFEEAVGPTSRIQCQGDFVAASYTHTHS